MLFLALFENCKELNKHCFHRQHTKNCLAAQKTSYIATGFIPKNFYERLFRKTAGIYFAICPNNLPWLKNLNPNTRNLFWMDYCRWLPPNIYSHFFSPDGPHWQTAVVSGFRMTNTSELGFLQCCFYFSANFESRYNGLGRKIVYFIAYRWKISH